MTATAPGARQGTVRADPASRSWYQPHAVTVVVLVVGLIITGGLAYAVGSVHTSNEDRLLQQRLSESSLILTSAVPSITSVLNSTAELAEASGANPQEIQQVLAPSVGTAPGQSFRSVSVWRADGRGQPLVVVGARPHQAGTSGPSLRQFIRQTTKPGLRVRDMLSSDPAGLGYAATSARPDRHYVVYAESALPADRTQRAQSAPAFQDLDYAVYLGKKTDSDKLLLASTEHLPLTGRRQTATSPFGDNTLLMAMSARGDLGGHLMARLPYLILLVGLIASLVVAWFVERLLRRRELAQHLAEENDRLYRDQRSVAETLQRSLLPDVLPELDGLQLDARYEPGVEGIEIGGDWYDVVAIDEDRVLLVVGDVSGRGLGAGAVMASIRYAIRAHATQGDGPGTILGKLGSILQVTRDRHFATVLCIEVRRSDATLRVANAGHPLPLVLNGTGADFIATDTGPPIGIDSGRTYAETVVGVPSGGTLLMFTDGLFERRGEGVDDGMDRLRRTAQGIQGDLPTLLDRVLDLMIGGVTTDDTALLGVRWLA
jgi:serine phosphatase RsbU (regulator of sigma subunit)